MLQLLSKYVLPHVQKSMWFQNYGVPPISHIKCTIGFTKTFWAWKCSHLAFTVHLSLAPPAPDFKLWECMKEIVYAMEVQNRDNLINHNEVTTKNIRNQLRQLVAVRGFNLMSLCGVCSGGRTLWTSALTYSTFLTRTECTQKELLWTDKWKMVQRTELAFS